MAKSSAARLADLGLIPKIIKASPKGAARPSRAVGAEGAKPARKIEDLELGMADIAQVLLLPPPQRLPSQALTPRARADLAASGNANGANDAAQARRFRFRVYEGDDTGGTNTRYDARRTETATNVTQTGNGVDDTEFNANQQNGSTGRAATVTYQRGSGSGASSAFLAQSIAQEQLGEGLHNPPNAAATQAYNSAGAAVTPRASAGVDITA